jgi:hypothetical protein
MKDYGGYFWYGLHGKPDYLAESHIRARWVVADALRQMAKEEECAIASRMRLLAGQIEAGYAPTKKVLGKLGRRRLTKLEYLFGQLANRKVVEP